MSSVEFPASSSSDLDGVAQRKSELHRILANRRPKIPLLFVSFGAVALAIFGANVPEIPLVTRLALVVAATLAPITAFEVWALRRRFDAAIELLGLSSEKL